MIWIPKNQEDDRRDALIAHLAGTIKDCIGDVDWKGAPEQAVDLAAAVAAFIQQQSNPLDCIESGYLVLLAVKAMSGVGESDAARRLMVFGSGLVRPAEWEVTGGGDVWTLDLHRMLVSEDAPLELIFYNTLGMIVESMVEVWDATDGAGVLGLRHVYASALALLGGGGPPSALREITREIRQTCSLRLERARHSRGWQTIPRVMNLDLLTG